MKSCLIFDLDGTLVDSEGLCNQGFLDLLPTLDDSVASLTKRYRGRKLAEILSDLETRLQVRLPADFEIVYRERVGQLFSTQLQPMAGAEEFLASSDYPRCIASSGPPEKIAHTLQVTGLDKYFRHVFSAYEIESWKPDPSLFLHAASVMGFHAAQCVVIEDSDVGIAAAQAAGMTAFHFLPSGEHENSQGVTRFESMSELNRLLDCLPRD